MKRLDDLKTATLTYPEVGATAATMPSGYDHLRESRVLGTGRALFEQTAEQLMTWELHRRSGLTVRASSEQVAEGVVVLLGFGLGPLRLPIPGRVVYVIDEPDRQGFAYGTLPGHPEMGEELFQLELLDDERVVLTVRAFSRPALWWSKLGRPVARQIQRLVTRRYLRALVPD